MVNLSETDSHDALNSLYIINTLQASEGSGIIWGYFT